VTPLCVGFKYLHLNLFLKKNKMMITKGEFFGPKALFDPSFIPPKLLHRRKEQKSLISILSDSISDEFCLNILYQGINGIGKKVIVNKVINDLSMQSNNYNTIQKVSIDCKDKNFEELVFSLLTDLVNLSQFNCSFETLLNSNISHLWNVFKLLCKKIDARLFFIFTNVEYLEPDIFKKFLHFGKENNITSLYTINKILRTATIDIISEFDLKKKLNFFTYKELYSILKQRVLLTFSHNVDEELIKYITDLICEQYVPVPGKGIEIFRNIYPVLKDNRNIKNFELIELCQNHFDQMQIDDEFTLLNYISEEDVLTIIFLDNLSNYFISKMNYYISLTELEELYQISCESLEYKKNNNEFYMIIKDLLNNGILRPSKKKTQSEIFLDNILNTDSYFMVISPNQLKVLIDTVFEKY
jgi:Cdc6-like AAA superfamily ATPase